MNGKGSKPRNNFSESFRNNFDQINWTTKRVTPTIDSNERTGTTESTRTDDLSGHANEVGSYGTDTERQKNSVLHPPARS